MSYLRYLLWFVLPLFTHAADIPSARHAFIVIAHRGSHSHAHENTLTALQRAIDIGADYAEIDVRRTLDGQHVLMHDSTVDRMTDGHGAIKQLTWAQLQQLHVRDRKRPEIAADRIPAFEEVLQLIKGRLNLYLDFKEGDRAAVARAIQKSGTSRQVLVYDDVDAVAEWHRVAPELPLIVSPPDEIKTSDQLVRFANTYHVDVLDSSWEGYSREMVQAAIRAGVRVWPDIQAGKENAEYFATVLRAGFTGVQTDHPEELINWLNQQHLR